MANPNRTVARSHNSRALVVANQLTTYNRTEVAGLEDQLRAAGFTNVRTTSTKTGPRPTANNGFRQSYLYTVRAYVRAAD
jgi:hypothetical protein